MLAVTSLQLFVPVPGYGPGAFEEAGTINAWLDQLLLPGRLHYEVYDPEGILCMVSAVAVTLMGGLAGYVIRSSPFSMRKKALWVAGGGLAALVLALALSPFYPVIKKIWTVSYVLLSGGISTILLSMFYFVSDILKIRKWTPFFVVFGMNAITIYLGDRILDFGSISGFFLGWTRIHINELWGEVFVAIGILTLQSALLYFLYRKRIILRV